MVDRQDRQTFGTKLPYRRKLLFGIEREMFGAVVHVGQGHGLHHRTVVAGEITARFVRCFPLALGEDYLDNLL